VTLVPRLNTPTKGGPDDFHSLVNKQTHRSCGFLRPYLISRGVRMPMVLIFLGVLGGLLAFGIVGVFLGPVLLVVAHTLFQDWGRASETASGHA
jgi:hypothetical protein